MPTSMTTAPAECARRRSDVGPRRPNQHLCVPRHGDQILRLRVRHCYGGVPLQKELGQRLSNEVGTPDDNGICALQLDAFVLQQRNYTKRGAGQQSIDVTGQPASAGGGETVDILFPRDPVYQRLGVQMGGQGKWSRMPDTAGLAASSSSAVSYMFLASVFGRRRWWSSIPACWDSRRLLPT